MLIQIQFKIILLLYMKLDMVAHCFIVKTNMLTRTIPVGSLKMAQEFCNTFQNLQVKKKF